MPDIAPIIDNYGAVPPLEELALVVASTSATMVVEFYGADGKCLTVPKTLTVTSTAQSIHTIMATASVTWDEAYVGMKIIKVNTATVYYNYGARLARSVTGNSVKYTASVEFAPTTASLSIPAADYSAGGWALVGRVV